MKRIVLLILIFLPMLASADAIEIGGIYYNLTEDTRVAEVAKNPQKYKGDITIPESVEYEGVTYSVTKIGYSAFASCASLTSIEIPSSVTNIGQLAFDGCSSLTSITIPSSVTSIDAWAFSGCSGLTSVDIPSSVTKIGSRVFQDCSNLTSITIPNSVTSIGSYAFWRCTSLPSIIIPNSVTSIGENTFEYCYGLTSVTIPNSVTKIGGFAFHGCSKIASITIPNSVTDICERAFLDCTGLTSISIPNSVKNIENDAFAACNALTSVTIGNGVNIMGSHAFYYCDNITSVYISDLESWCKIHFIDSASNPLYYAHHLILNGVEIKDLVIPNSITSILANSFYKCSSLTSVTIPDGVTSIGDNAFAYCSGLTSITIPNNVTNIGHHAFDACNGVTSVIIGSKVESLGTYALGGCQKLLDIYCYAENAPKTQKNTFRNTNIEEVTLHVPAASVSAYQAVEPWKNFKEIVALQTQESDTDDSDYVPFVEEGKHWHVARFTPGHNDMDVVDYYIPQGIEEINGNIYYKMKAILNNTTEIETYLIREENRKVYLYDPDLKMEYLMFDFSLKEGDIYESYSNESHSMERYGVLSVGDCTEGPQVREYYYDETADTMAVRYRYLRKWAVKSADYGYALAPRIWIEGIGSLRNPFSGMSDGYYSKDHLTYINYSGQNDNYLPFSFSEWWDKEWFGCNLPIGAEYDDSEDGHHQLTYELEGSRLHVYGKVFCNCGPNHYAYFIEEPREQTDDPLVRKFHFEIQDVEPLVWCEGLHATDFYVDGVNPAYDYYIVDNQGEEHHVINKAPLYVYRPFVEDSKVWAVKVVSDGPPAEEWIEYYYFDGDTIVNGQTAKRMLCDRITSRQETNGEYVGAWYEQNKEVYFAASGKQQFELLYDFSLISYDTMPSPDGSTWVVYKWTGIYPGFKGTYYTFGQESWYEGVGSNSWPFVNHPWGYDGDKGILLECSVGDEVIYYNSAEGYPYGMGARNRFDFTHTIKTKPKARNRSGAESEQSLYGEYNDLQLGINLNPLDEAYQVRITNESGEVVYEKNINAGNIVGLNIDISAYAKGRYTVTVENSQEAFTGEFDTQTTEIKEVRSQRSEVRSVIYNLQGQRLSTLHKGLNIVNGQKVFVK